MASSQARLVKISKFLSLHLRHQPERLGLTLAPGGWVPVEDLLQAAVQRGFPIDPAELAEVVSGSDKQRFAYAEDGRLIRAHQGHSVAVDLELQPVEPPPVLYHGTGQSSVPTIAREGLKKMKRHHVHLSPDTVTAQKVGARHGKPVIFAVDAQRMAGDGHVFFCSANGVWLTESVPSQYLTPLD